VALCCDGIALLAVGAPDARWLAVTNEETGKEELWDAAGVVGRAANATNQ